MNEVYKTLPHLCTSISGQVKLLERQRLPKYGPGMGQNRERVGPLQEMGPGLLGNRLSNEIYSRLQIEYVVSLLIMRTSNICLAIALCQALQGPSRHSLLMTTLSDGFSFSAAGIPQSLLSSQQNPFP